MFNNILKFLQKVGDTILDALGDVFSAAAKSAVATLDDMVRQNTAVAIKYVQEAAAQDLSSDEKRSLVWTKLVQHLQAQGHDIKAAGFNAFVNLLIETGVNLVKVIGGQSLAQTSPPKPSA